MSAPAPALRFTPWDPYVTTAQVAEVSGAEDRVAVTDGTDVIVVSRADAEELMRQHREQSGPRLWILFDAGVVELMRDRMVHHLGLEGSHCDVAAGLSYWLEFGDQK